MLVCLMRRLLILVGSITGVLLWGEYVHWRSSRRRMGDPQGSGGREAVLVLGYKNRGTSANYINRFRLRAALRSQDSDAQESVLVMCGGSVASEIAEADLMARCARFEFGYTGPILTEPDSRTTWENIQNAIPLIEQFDVIKIVSNSLHAEKARAYLWRLRPDLAQRLVAAKDYRFGEMAFVKPVAALIGLENLQVIESTPEVRP